MSGGGKTFACDSLTGLHLGFGLNVSADEYKSDVDVLGIAEYMKNIGKQTWEFTGPRYTAENADTGGVGVNTDSQINYNKYKVKYEEKDDNYGDKDTITIEDSNHDIKDTITKTVYINNGDNVNQQWVLNGATTFLCAGISVINGKISLKQVPVHTKKGILTDKLFNAITSACDNTKTVGELYQENGHSLEDFGYHNNGAKGVVKYPNLTEVVVRYNSQLKTEHTYMESHKHFNGKAVKCGGELKMSYFHNIMNNFSLGLDISGVITSCAKKSSKINALRGSIEDEMPGVLTNNYVISYKDPDSEAEYQENCSVPKAYFFAIDKNGIQIIPERTYTIEREITGGSPADTNAFKAANPDYTEVAQPSDLSQYLQISNEKGGDVTFEKNKFNSRAAVVLGAQYKGWFAGIRGGVSYNQGKIHAKDITGTSTEDVSFAAPFVGVHLMKGINMKGLENGHIYVTADVNVQNKQNLKMKGIKNFRQNSVNVSLGMTWRIN